MSPIIPQRKSPGVAGAPDPGVTVRSRRCWLCKARPGKPCTDRGDHLGRWLAAYTDRVISREDLKVVIVRLVVVTKWAVVDEQLTGRAA